MKRYTEKKRDGNVLSRFRREIVDIMKDVQDKFFYPYMNRFKALSVKNCLQIIILNDN